MVTSGELTKNLKKCNWKWVAIAIYSYNGSVIWIHHKIDIRFPSNFNSSTHYVSGVVVFHDKFCHYPSQVDAPKYLLASNSSINSICLKYSSANFLYLLYLTHTISPVEPMFLHLTSQPFSKSNVQVFTFTVIRTNLCNHRVTFGISLVNLLHWLDIIFVTNRRKWSMVLCSLISILFKFEAISLLF